MIIVVGFVTLPKFYGQMAYVMKLKLRNNFLWPFNIAMNGLKVQEASAVAKKETFQIDDCPRKWKC